MPCYHPLQGWRSRMTNPTGKRGIVFKRTEGYEDLPVTLPCGQCIGCRLERSRQWAIRMVHEASLYENNCFLTLTYAPEHLPADGSLQLEHFQKFMKRLRKKYGSEIRFFHCGEYGENYGRPHYHACIFNHDFPDKIHYQDTKQGHKLYSSAILDEIWGLGSCTIGDLTFETAAYTARYIMKKVTGDKAPEHYGHLKPEYTTMSRGKGIGKQWLEKYQTDVYPSDFIVLRGKKMPPPKFYDRELEKQNFALYKELKGERIKNAKKSPDNTSDRLEVREFIKKTRTQQLTRNYEAQLND